MPVLWQRETAKAKSREEFQVLLEASAQQQFRSHVFPLVKQGPESRVYVATTYIVLFLACGVTPQAGMWISR